MRAAFPRAPRNARNLSGSGGGGGFPSSAQGGISGEPGPAPGLDFEVPKIYLPFSHVEFFVSALNQGSLRFMPSK